MNLFKKLKEERWFQLTFAACSAVLLFFVLYNISYVMSFLKGLWTVVSPVIIGAVIAYIIDPLVRFFERTLFKKSKHPKFARNISVALATLVVIVVFALLLVAVIPPIIDSAVAIATIVRAAWDSLGDKIDQITFMGDKVPLQSIGEFFNSFAKQINIGDSIRMEDIIETSFGVGNGVVALVLGYIIAIYFMTDKTRIKTIIKLILKRLLKKKYVPFKEFCKKCDKIFLKYLACSILESIIVSTANAIFMAILGMPYIGLISVLVGITNLAPTFGPIFGAIIGSIILLLINPWYALWFLIFTLVIQTIDGYVIKPKFFGDTLGVSSLLILITIIVGGRLFGTLGILLSIPFAAIGQVIVKDYILKKNTTKEVTSENKEA